MPKFVYDRERAGQEYQSAKLQLREYYLWRFGYKVPASWTADHQVEQSIYLYERFGPQYIHNIANMLMVPREVNIGKNVFYGKPWSAAPPKLRNFLPRTIQLVHLQPTKPCRATLAADGKCVEVSPDGSSPLGSTLARSERIDRPLAIREVLYIFSRVASDIRTWSFLQEVSREVLKQIVDELSQTRWKDNPPEWLMRFPRWLGRLREELDNHDESVTDYLKHKSF